MVVKRAEGDIVVIANNLSKENIYVSSATVNGVPVSGTIQHSQIAKGATIVFNMTGQKPNKK